ncbi:hypothetical protein FOZ63_001487 [Perkinsus olseni]|uniref:Uncharacterized protein n=1 Tax=Perkinsus olseni TaxID=32597 RepID=A0A7J6R317_PEROL|nr:hypothetical protein FOZ63_001487 [Perkinsus olseni]
MPFLSRNTMMLLPVGVALAGILLTFAGCSGCCCFCKHDAPTEGPVEPRQSGHWRLRNLREFLRDHTPFRKKKPKNEVKVLNLEPLRDTTEEPATTGSPVNRLPHAVTESPLPDDIEKELPQTTASDEVRIKGWVGPSRKSRAPLARNPTLCRRHSLLQTIRRDLTMSSRMRL